MNANEIQGKLVELKADYARIMGDMDKVEAVGQRTNIEEKQLALLEKEISDLNRQLDELE
ncbi:SE1832 family protein [Virgibacillus sp. DJP39]|uniref:SE1832 family protein n=1 Tax=Virgibacillus sp. DJP39 TaxID=3409790 RepID=UPI003BB6C2E9